MRTGQNFWILYALLVICQVALCNYAFLGPYIMLTMLPAMVMCIPLTVSTPLCMLIAFASGLAVDWLAEGLIGINAASLIPVAVCRTTFIRIFLGEDIINRKDSFSIRKNGSGKTYLLNALLDEIPAEESVLVVQENEELFSDVHPDMMFQHIAVQRGDKKINYELKDLVINGLLTDIDHIVIGEIKGEEALHFITAALTGCHGMTTIHSIDAKGALDKLADYCKWASDYSREEIFKMLSCVKTIVYIDDFKITEIVENRGWDEKAKVNQLDVVYDQAKGVCLI